MFKYINDISSLSHSIIERFVENCNVAVDCTLGNGHDTDFLSQKFQKVFAFDIQKEVTDFYREKKVDNVEVINDSHHRLDYYIEFGVDCIMYNLGFLPGGNKKITTKSDTSLISIKKAVPLLNKGGLITIGLYLGHNEGIKEKEVILKFVSTLPKNEYGVMLHKVINRSETAPMLLVIERK